MLVDRRGRSVAAKEGGGGGGGGGVEEEEGGASQSQATSAAGAGAGAGGGGGGEEEEERILGEFTTETAEIMEELDGIVADGQGNDDMLRLWVYMCIGACACICIYKALVGENFPRVSLFGCIDDNIL